jgi:hypothetical protein
MRNGMTTTLGLVLLAVLAGGGLGLAQQQPAPERTPRGQAPATTGPALHLQNTEIDLGRIPEGEEAEATFVVENRGTAVLRILKAKAG